MVDVAPPTRSLYMIADRIRLGDHCFPARLVGQVQAEPGDDGRVTSVVHWLAISGFVPASRAGTSYWASLERLFTSPANKTCNMWIWLKATSTTYSHIKFNVEIIEPVSFTYVALKPVEYSNNVPFGYAKYVVGPWRTTANQQLLFRVSLFGAAGPFGDAAFLDDMTLYCA